MRIADNKIMIYNGLEQQCKSCKNQIVGKFKAQPFCIFVQLLRNISFLELPPTITIDHEIFNFLCFSIATKPNSIAHFKCTFYLQKLGLVDRLTLTGY